MAKYYGFTYTLFIITFGVFCFSKTLVAAFNCQSCTDVQYRFVKADLIESLMSSVLGDIDFTDAACRNDQASRQYCSDPWGSDIPACASSTLTVNASGISTLGYYDAQMIIEIVSRRCGSLSSGQTDHCTPISHLNEIQSQTVNVGAFARLTRRFDSVTYQGQECYTVEPQTKTPTPENLNPSGVQTQSPTRRYSYAHRPSTTPWTNGGQRPTNPFTTILTILHLLVLNYSLWC